MGITKVCKSIIDDTKFQFRLTVFRYWQQRYDIFSKYDGGIWMTDDAWFGITPEPVANKIAEHVAQFTPANKTILIDAFSGAGGSTIAFAKSNRWSQVIAMDHEPNVMQCAKHNACIYQTDTPIMWVLGDVYEDLPTLPASARKSAVVFASPPWGGPGYRSDEVFNLMTMHPYPIKQLYETLRKVADHIVLYLPRTSDLRQLAALVGEGQKIRVTHYCMWGASKAMCAFIGPSEHTEEISRKEPSTANGVANDQRYATSLDHRTRLYLGGLASTATEEDVREFFEGYQILSMDIRTKSRSKTRLGYAFVELIVPAEAERAVKELSGKELCQRKVLVQPARKHDSTGENGEGDPTRLKKKFKRQ
ncbi:MAG: hypothetical protein M1816_007803 [Peltula sp. TS41687]|nr:MAG: hypothetical protein M1816_007803 [Peltula sp. TS41687]